MFISSYRFGLESRRHSVGVRNDRYPNILFALPDCSLRRYSGLKQMLFARIGVSGGKRRGVGATGKPLIKYYH